MSLRHRLGAFLEQRALALALACAALAPVNAVPQSIAFLLAGAALLAVAIGARWSVGPGLQVGVGFALAFCGVGAAQLLGPGGMDEFDAESLSEREVLFLVPLVWVGLFRSVLLNPVRGKRLTLALGVLGLAAGGGALAGWVFPTCSALFLVLASAGLAANDSGREFGMPSPRRALGGALLLGLVLASAGASFHYLPDVQAALLKRIYDRLGRSRVGFSEHLELGDMTGLLTDDTVVLRVRGENAPLLLRGEVFTQYGSGLWRGAMQERPSLSTNVSVERLSGNGWIELEHARRPERYFLPLDAHAVTTSSGAFLVDRLGVLRPATREYATRVWFRRSTIPRVKDPAAEEGSLSPDMTRALRQILRDWGLLELRGRELLDALQRKLVGHGTYSLISEREQGGDPVLDFLRNNPSGHCEYFASSFALLARAGGVPTRVIAGYRVSERSRFGYYLVRRQNAHAWVEAWADGAWHTFDPTPSDGLLAASPIATPLFSALWQQLRTSLISLEDFFARRTTFEILVALLILGAFWAVERTRRGWRSKVEARRGGPSVVLRRVPEFEQFCADLARCGLRREPTETLLQFAWRLRASPILPGELREAACSALIGYESFLYGAEGEEMAILSSLEQTSLALKRTAIPG